MSIGALLYVKARYRTHEFVQMVGRLESDGWLARVYVNHEITAA